MRSVQIKTGATMLLPLQGSGKYKQDKCSGYKGCNSYFTRGAGICCPF